MATSSGSLGPRFRFVAVGTTHPSVSCLESVQGNAAPTHDSPAVLPRLPDLLAEAERVGATALLKH